LSCGGGGGPIPGGRGGGGGIPPGGGGGGGGGGPPGGGGGPLGALWLAVFVAAPPKTPPNFASLFTVLVGVGK